MNAVVKMLVLISSFLKFNDKVSSSHQIMSHACTSRPHYAKCHEGRGYCAIRTLSDNSCAVRTVIK